MSDSTFAVIAGCMGWGIMVVFLIFLIVETPHNPPPRKQSTQELEQRLDRLERQLHERAKEPQSLVFRI